jgi:hypothetical protein
MEQRLHPGLRGSAHIPAMRNSAKVKIALGLVVVFAAGAIFGSFARAQYTERAFMKSLDYTKWSAAILNDLDRELQLSPEQKEKAKVLLENTVSAVTNSFTHLGQELVRLHCQLQDILTPEQQAKNEKSFADCRRALGRYQICLPAETNVAQAPTREK